MAAASSPAGQLWLCRYQLIPIPTAACLDGTLDAAGGQYRKVGVRLHCVGYVFICSEDPAAAVAQRGRESQVRALSAVGTACDDLGSSLESSPL